MSTQTLLQLQLDMTRFGFLACVGMGNLSSFIGLLVFFKARLRKNSCIIFLIAYIISNLIYVDFTILTTALAGYGFDWTHRSMAFCRLRMYISFAFSTIPSYLLVMASWDRMCISSANIRIRSMANHRFSILSVLVICVFWSLFHIHAIFGADIIPLSSTRVTCNTRPGTMTTFVTYYTLIFDGFVPLVLMIIFGTRTWLNVQRTNFSRSQKRERRIISLLIIQLAIFVCLRLPTSLHQIYLEATKFNLKTTDRVITDRFILFIVVFCQFIQVSVSPALNLCTQTFRMELRLTCYKFVNRNLVFNHRQTQNTVALSIVRNREQRNTIDSNQNDE